MPKKGYKNMFISAYISKVNGHFLLKLGRVPSIYGALMLLNFCGNQGRRLGTGTKLFGISKSIKLFDFFTFVDSLQ